MNKLTNKKRTTCVCARDRSFALFCVPFAISLDDLSCPYETCFNLCVSCAALICIWYFFFSRIFFANIYLIPKELSKHSQQKKTQRFALPKKPLHAHSFRCWRCLKMCTNRNKNGNRSFPTKKLAIQNDLEKSRMREKIHMHRDTKTRRDEYMRQHFLKECKIIVITKDCVNDAFAYDTSILRDFRNLIRKRWL